jgi:hypothetical protein
MIGKPAPTTQCGPAFPQHEPPEAPTEKCIAPLHDRISSIVIGYTDTRLSHLARRTCAMQQEVLKA